LYRKPIKFLPIKKKKRKKERNKGKAGLILKILICASMKVKKCNLSLVWVKVAAE
jgi:hypothetical protein